MQHASLWLFLWLWLSIDMLGHNACKELAVFNNNKKLFRRLLCDPEDPGLYIES